MQRSQGPDEGTQEPTEAAFVRPKSLATIQRFRRFAVLSIVLSIIVTVGVMMLFFNQSISANVAAYGKMGLDGSYPPSCLEQPHNWRIQLQSNTTIYAYNIQTFRPSHPKAPVVSARMRRKIASGGKQAHSNFPIFRGGGFSVQRIKDSGPCSLIGIEWKLSFQEGFRTISRAALVVSFGILLCSLLGFFWVARPLFTRIEQLSALAEQTGDDSFSVDWPAPKQDDLGIIEHRLKQAHERILSDKRELALRNQALREHIANVAHDLKTPIASLQLVLERVSQQQKDAEGDLVVAMADAVYLEQLTNNLGLATQLEEGLWDPNTRQVLSLGEEVERVCGRFQVLADEKGVQMAFGVPDETAWALADATLLERALSNLIYNALHHNQAGGHVSLLLQRQGDGFVIKVMDDGPGVPPTELEKLSLRHYRSDSARKRQSTGQGLGLAITAEVCLRLGWDLSFSSIDPQGLCAEIKGPLTEKDSGV